MNSDTSQLHKKPVVASSGCRHSQSGRELAAPLRRSPARRPDVIPYPRGFPSGSGCRFGKLSGMTRHGFEANGKRRKTV
jgi:hypothetical protein